MDSPALIKKLKGNFMCYLVFFIFLLGQLAANEQHQIVWGQYLPPQVTAKEVASALETQESIDLKPIGGGFSGGHLYSLRLNNTDYIVRRTGGVYGPKGAPQEVAIIKEASKLGICPKLYYANSETGLIIMEKIDNILPPEFCPRMLLSTPELLEQMAAHLRSLNKLKLDKSCITDRFEMVIFKEAAESIDKSPLSAAELKTVEEVLSWPVDKSQRVITHNDVHCRNLLFDGKKLYIIDWEMAGWGLPGYDLAGFCNFQVMTREEGIAFYTMYVEREATSEEIAQFMRLRVIHAATCGMQGFSYSKPDAKDPIAHLRSESIVSTLRNVLLYLDRGKIDLKDNASLQALGITWLQFATYLLHQ